MGFRIGKIRSFVRFAIFAIVVESGILAANSMTAGAEIFSGPVSAARWLWIEKTARDNTIGYFRRRLQLDEPVKKAEFTVIFDDGGFLWINGRQLQPAAVEEPKKILPTFRFDATAALQKGANLLAVEDRNGTVMAGFILRGQIELQSGKIVTVASNDSWRAAATLSDGWQKNDYDDSSWSPAIEVGDAMNANWEGRVANAPLFMMTPEEHRAYDGKLETAAQIDLAKLPALRAEVFHNRQIAGIRVNGQPEAPFINITVGSPWPAGVADMVTKSFANGVKFQMYCLTSATIMSKPDQYDFTPIDRNVRRLLTMAPECALMLEFRFEPPPWWMERHPDELIDYPVPGPFGTNQEGKYLAPSYASELWRQEMKNCLDAFMKYLANQPWSKRIVGINIASGWSCEWHYYGMAYHMPDTGKAMTARFRKYLRGRYADDAALQAAWHNPDVTLESAAVPDADERRNSMFLRNPDSRDRKTLDYYESMQETVSETLLGLAEFVKKTHPEWLVGAYYGYIWGMHFPSEGQTLALDRVLSSPAIDFLQSPYCYDRERNIGGDGLMRAIAATFRRYGKLSIMEADVRTHLAKVPPGWEASRAPAESEALFQRDFAMTMMNGCGVDLLQFGGKNAHEPNWFNAPEILRTFAAAEKIFQRLQQNPPADFPGDVAVVYNPSDMVRQGPPTRPTLMNNLLTTESMHQLLRAGVAADQFMLADYLADDHTYRCIVFLNLSSPTPAEREAILKKVRRPGVTTIWIYAPGLITDQGFSDAAMEQLTGLKLQFQEQQRPMEMKFDDGAVLKDMSELKPVAVAPTVIGQDPDARILARYPDGAVAMLCRQRPDGSASLWSGVPLKSTRAWTRIFDLARVHRYVPEGTVFHRQGNLLLLHTGKAAAIPVTLDRRYRRATELYTGKILGADTDRLNLKSDGPATWFIELEN